MFYLRSARVSIRVGTLLTLLLSSQLPAGAAQDKCTAALRGRVTDSYGHPIAGARLSVVDRHPEAGAATIAGQDGRFQLRLASVGSLRVRASAPGFQTREFKAALVAGSVVSHTIVLEAAPYDLPAITVTGVTRAEIASLPGAATVVGSAVIHNRAPVSVMDALRTVPGVQTADEDPYGLNLNIGFRGLPPRRSSRTLLLEDGVPILLGPYGDPTMHYAPPVESLERIEIVKGSGQIMNGPQTVGGVVNFVTRRPPSTGRMGALTLGGGALGYRNGHLWAGTAHYGYGVAIDYTFREGEGVRREQGHRFNNAVVSGFLPLLENQSLVLKTALWDEISRISEMGLTQAEFRKRPVLPSVHCRRPLRRATLSWTGRARGADGSCPVADQRLLFEHEPGIVAAVG